MRKVAIGATNGDTVAVSTGLQVGERVVVEGTDKLRDGAKVLPAVDAPVNAAARGQGVTPGGKHSRAGEGKTSDAAGGP